MKRFLTLLLLLPLPLFAADEFRAATPAELAMKDVSWSPGAPAVILDWSVNHDDESSFATEYVRIKVLTEEGKKYGDVELLSMPRFHSVKSIEARTTRPDGTVVPFTGKIYDKVLIRRGGLKVMQKTFTLPEVQPGSIIEYRYTIRWSLTRLRTNRWTLQRDIPLLKAHFSIRPSRQVRSLCTTKGLPPDVKVEKVKDRFELDLANVSAFVEEPYALPESELRPRLEFFYVHGDATDYWMTIGEIFGGFMEQFIGDRRGMKKAAAELVAGAESDEEKLRRLYARVQQLRNLSFERDKTEQEEKRDKLRDPKHVEDVLHFGYGTRSELNRLFVGLARAAGFDATIALVAERDEVFFSRALPDIDQLEGEIAVVKIDGKDRFFDPGTPHLRFGMLAWENTSVPALRLARKGAGGWVETNAQPYSQAQTVRTADLQLDGGTLKGTASITYRGQEALVKRLEALNEDEETTRKLFEDELKDLFADGSSVKLNRITHLAGTEEPLVVHFDVELPHLVSETASRALVPASVFAHNATNPFAAETRRSPVYFSYEHQVEDRVTVRLPDGFAVESVPKRMVIDVGGAGYSAEWKSDPQTVTFERRLTLKTIAIAPDKYKTLRNFFGDVVNADQQALVLKKTGL